MNTYTYTVPIQRFKGFNRQIVLDYSAPDGVIVNITPTTITSEDMFTVTIDNPNNVSGIVEITGLPPAKNYSVTIELVVASNPVVYTTYAT